jgi:pimeloyl-ACP methyl ester carboxylesterase
MPSASGTLHTYHPTRGLLLFEHFHHASAPPPNILIFVGGMFDNFLSPGYTVSLAQLFRGSSKWRIVHIQLSSAMRGFGISSLSRDVAELSIGVKFVRENLLAGNSGGKVVLMGHSTGTQDLISYCYLDNKIAGPLSAREKVDGIILQAAVSDRDAATPGADVSRERQLRWTQCLDLARSTPEGERRTTILPMHLTNNIFGPAPLSVERFLSLASPDSPGNPAEDDLLSSDASDEWLRKTWGTAFGSSPPEDEGVLRALSTTGEKQPLIILSGNDEHVPTHVNQEALLEKWQNAVAKAGGALHRSSQVIDGAIHDVSGDDAASFRAREVVLRRAVVEYLADVLGLDDGSTAKLETSIEHGLSKAEEQWRFLESQEQQQQQQQQQTTTTEKPETAAKI